MPVRDQNELTDRLSRDMAWRRRELVSLSSMVQQGRRHNRAVAIRATGIAGLTAAKEADRLRRMSDLAELPQRRTLVAVLWPPAVPGRGAASWVEEVARISFLALAGSALLAVSAKVRVPLEPVPQTMQTFVVLMIGMTYGWRLGGLTLLVYLTEGALGLPVFAGTPEKGIGIPYLLGTTGGYLVGFVLAALVVGFLAEAGWDRNLLLTAAAMLIGNIVIYVPGLLWLGHVAGWDNPILQWGLTPFILFDLVKLLWAALLLPAAWRLVNRS